MSPIEPAPCPRCGAVRTLTDVPGICPACLARGLLGLGGQPTNTPLAPPPALPEVSGWRLLRLVGAGGMGQVYEAESTAGRTPGAIKILDARWTDDPVMAARFEGEAEALRRLAHPAIVKLLETNITTDGRLCLIMEWVEGCDLGRLLRAEKLPHARAMDLFRKVCQATAHAHAAGFLHRDIKPSNILAGKDGTVKLADFGLAREFSAEGGPASARFALTATTDQFGTAYYLAPERMLLGSHSTATTDVYSLGVLFYHLMSGRMPLGNYQPLSTLEPLPGKIDSVIAQAPAADPEQRTPTATALAQAVESVWQLHCAGTDQQRFRRRLTAAAAGVLLLAAAAGAGACWQWQRLRPPAPPVFANPSLATETRPWRNSLGMDFVPVPGLNVLFSINETRRRDYEPFRQTVIQVMSTPWMVEIAERARQKAQSVVRIDEAGNMSFDGNWENQGFPVTPDHPAGGIGIRDAACYCLWLTDLEKKQGRLQAGQRYRVPTRREWFTACGGMQAGLRPGNLAGPEATVSNWPKSQPTLPQRDSFARSAPVGSFPAELFGLRDMSGNLTEWTLDQEESTAIRDNQSKGLLTGPCFIDGTAYSTSFSFNRNPHRMARLAYAGFRIVLETGPAPASTPAPDFPKASLNESTDAPSPPLPSTDPPD